MTTMTGDLDARKADLEAQLTAARERAREEADARKLIQQERDTLAAKRTTLQTERDTLTQRRLVLRAQLIDGDVKVERELVSIAERVAKTDLLIAEFDTAVQDVDRRLTAASQGPRAGAEISRIEFNLSRLAFVARSRQLECDIAALVAKLAHWLKDAASLASEYQRRFGQQPAWPPLEAQLARTISQQLLRPLGNGGVLNLITQRTWPITDRDGRAMPIESDALTLSGDARVSSTSAPMTPTAATSADIFDPRGPGGRG
jgi:hypothetical protein